jgi:hypothetical protein
MGKGDFQLHLGPEGLESLRQAAEKAGVSMQQYAREALEMRVSAGQPGGGSLAEALRLVERAARALQAQVSPASPPPSPADTWEALMQDGSS